MYTSSNLSELRQRLLLDQIAMECGARHRFPKATVTHPQGVIVPGDQLLTDNIKDPDYVPYCGPCVPFQRMRRAVDGFQCPTCDVHLNWDLTRFNGNVAVQFEEGFEAPLSPESIQPISPVVIPPPPDWQEDHGKKNTFRRACPKCSFTFFGKRNRKVCVLCANFQSLPK